MTTQKIMKTSVLFFILGFILLYHIVKYYTVKTMKITENYQNYDINSAMSTGLGGYKKDKQSFPETDVLLQDSYPLTGRKGISNNGAANIWWHYPIFELGSYDQITNNIRYSNTPDEGTCMPASMCGALYKEKQLKTNYVKPLPPINPECGTRVGYFDTNVNLLPFRSDMQNILY